MIGKQCPMSNPVCMADCAWFMDGKCAVVRIAEKFERRPEMKLDGPTFPIKRGKRGDKS